MVNWLEGNIKEVAKVFHRRNNLYNITYKTYSNSVVFFSDGFFVAKYDYFPISLKQQRKELDEIWEMISE